MVVLAQLAEHRIVVPSVVGSSPTFHPKKSHSGAFFVEEGHLSPRPWVLRRFALSIIALQSSYLATLERLLPRAIFEPHMNVRSTKKEKAPESAFFLFEGLNLRFCLAAPFWGS